MILVTSLYLTNRTCLCLYFPAANMYLLNVALFAYHALNSLFVERMRLCC